MKSDGSTLHLDGDLTIYQAGERWEELRQVLQECVAQSSGQQPQLTMDTHDLIDVDSAGLQLLVQFSQRARDADIAVNWQTPGAALTNMISLYNAWQWFAEPAEATS